MIIDSTYLQWLTALKNKIRLVQLKAAVAVNEALIAFYWEIGKMIAEKQTEWGTQFLDRLSKDLRTEFPDMGGFSVTNLKYCRMFYVYFQISPQAGEEMRIEISPQLGDEIQDTEYQLVRTEEVGCPETIKQLPWGHIKLIIDKIKDKTETWFYVEQTIQNYWSRDVLALQIKSGLYKRQGKAVTNFKQTLPAPFSDLAEQTLKDPYVFDFMTMTKPYHERDIENKLTDHITKFLLELGRGFAFVGQQYNLVINGKDYYIDLLFYHIKLKCYVVIELKNTSFIPEYTGKLNFYLSAVDSLVKQDDDKPTIGMILCRDKDNIDVEFALRDMNKPIGVSEFNLTEILPEELKSSLPTVEEIENELSFNSIDSSHRDTT